jgi:G3E family GTPase
VAAQPDAIPVITIGGYLGAGKTTLLNALLAGDHGRRIAVLVNDFGSISIDEKLIAARDGEIVTLANGCACCSVAGDLGEALDKIARARTPPEYIVVEASGIADPARIAALANSPGLTPRATIVLADADTIVVRARDKFVGRLVRRQLAGADLVILNKIDLVDEEKTGAARRLIARDAPAARLAEASYGAIAPDFLLGAVGTTRSPFICDIPGDDAAAAFESHCWTTTEAVDMPALRNAIAALPANVVRAKGIVNPLGGERAFEIHRVGDRIDIAAITHERSKATGVELVFVTLAKTLDRKAIDAAMNACLASAGGRS